jgi:hypothetical protein
MRYSEELRNARLNRIAQIIGSGAKMRLFADPPANTCASADPQTLLAVLDLPEKPFQPAAGGRLMSSAEPWRGFGVRQRRGKDEDDGTIATSFRIYDLTGQCRVQGDVGEGEWADLILSDCMIHASQPINITSFRIVEL